MSKRQDDYDRWLSDANAVESTDNPLKVPYDVALKEAVSAAAFVEKYWEPAGARPGLSHVKKRLPRATSEAIVSQVHAVQEAQTRLLLIVDPVVLDQGDRARVLVDELESAIAFTLDNDVHEEADNQLAQVRAFHAQDGQRSGALAQALRDYAALAKQLKARIVVADEAFDPAWITEATALAKTLDAAALDKAAASSDAARAAAATRNRLLSLLQVNVNLVRRTARHVFRNHPEIQREATSAYDRRRRAAARRAKDAPPPPAPQPGPTGGAAA